MTNKEDSEAGSDCNPRMAALLAVHLVSQVLDEAYVIANAANESGEPWRYLSMMKSFKTSRLGDADGEDLSFEASKGDCDLNENKMEIVANVVATSTPQKPATRLGCSGEHAEISRNDAMFIGQGDADIDIQKNELANSTSMFINHLFDMSDVERVVMCDDTEINQTPSEPNELIVAAMNKIMGSYIAHTMIPLETSPLISINTNMDNGQESVELSRSDNSDYSFLADAFVADISKDVTFYFDDDKITCEKNNNIERYESADVEVLVNEPLDENTQEMIQRNDVAIYENAYVTLNRDYDQCSEEDGFPILQDPKSLTLQEVELMTGNSSKDDFYPEFIMKEQAKETTATASGISGTRKSTLVRRCRLQGARLLACLRGWWRRKTPLKRKESRCPGAVHTICTLSPNARRRSSSLVDSRLLRSPSPSRAVVWKFNTVNDAVVNSKCWREYSFDHKPEDCGEY